MDIKSYALGFAMGKKKGGSGGGGKDPVLGELTVTENGVYDEPVIGGAPEPITWDGVVGDRVAVDAGGGSLLVKVSDRILSVAECADCTIGMSTGESVTVGAESMGEADGVVQIGYWVFSVANVDMFPETGTYFLKGDQGVTTSLTFAGDPPTPADGWNKVTVNVAGDIIDVPELPTENIEEGKIYRVTKESEETIDMYVYADGRGMSLEEYATDVLGTSMPSLTYEMVDALPVESADPYHIFILKETGIGHMYAAGRWFGFGFGITGGKLSDKGYTNDISSITENGVYTIYTPAESSTTYGIPNAHPVKRFVDGAWVELA